MNLIGCAALFFILALLVWWLDPNARRERRFTTKLKVREPLSDAAMVSRYFATDDIVPETPGRVRRLFAKQMGYPADKLLPDDDLTFYWYDLDMIELMKELEVDFGIEITDKDAEGTPCTIRDVSLLVSGKVKRLTCI